MFGGFRVWGCCKFLGYLQLKSNYVGCRVPVQALRDSRVQGYEIQRLGFRFSKGKGKGQP